MCLTELSALAGGWVGVFTSFRLFPRKGWHSKVIPSRPKCWSYPSTLLISLVYSLPSREGRIHEAHKSSDSLDLRLTYQVYTDRPFEIWAILMKLKGIRIISFMTWIWNVSHRLMCLTLVWERGGQRQEVQPVWGKWVINVPFKFLPLVSHLGQPSPSLGFLIAVGEGALFYHTLPARTGWSLWAREPRWTFCSLK